jgi:EmrB/QacA subfamily drug resistance transporter
MHAARQTGCPRHSYRHLLQFTPRPLPPTAFASSLPMTIPATAQPTEPTRAQFLNLFTAVMLPMFLAAVDQTLLATATPRIAADLGDLSDSAWIAVGYLLAATVMAPIYGRLGDRLGRRNALLTALLMFALGSLACGAARTLEQLIAGRVLQGLGGGGLMVLSQALIGELVPPHLRARYQGYFAVVFTASSVGGPLLGGLVVHHASWRWLFWANLPLCALAAWRVARLPKPARSAERDAPLDPVGVLLFVLTACSALLWCSLVGHHFALRSATSGLLLVLALGGGTLLWHQQRRHSHPFLPLDILRLPGVLPICLSVLSFAGSMFALVFMLPIVLQLAHGASATGAGLQLLPLTAGLVIGSTINGRLMARNGLVGHWPWRGLTAAALALLTLALAPPATGLITLAILVCGLGFGTVMPAAQLITQLLAGRARLGAAAALLSLTRSTGASFGTAAFGGLLFALLRLNGVPAEGSALTMSALPAEQLLHASHIVFGCLAAFVGLGAWAASRIPTMPLDPSAAADRLAAE